MTDEEESVEEVVEKKARGKVCKDCVSKLAADATVCTECGSENVRKVRYVVRKEVLAEVPSAEDEVPDYDDEEEESSKPPKPKSIFKGTKRMTIEMEDDEEDPEEDEEDMPNQLRVTKSLSESDVHALNTEVLALAMDFAGKVSKALFADDQQPEYDTVMNDVNKTFDAAFDQWKHGETLSKNDLASLKERLAMLKRKFKELTGEDYESDSMSKAHTEDDEDIYKGLHPEIAKRLQDADALVEKTAVADWENIAKKFDNVPADYSALGAALRTLSNTDASAYEVVKSTLEAANRNLADSEVFKSFGSKNVTPGSPNDRIENIAKNWVETGKYPTIEQARVAAMDEHPDFYTEMAR